jgi:molybdopterin converting factor small subunit
MALVKTLLGRGEVGVTLPDGATIDVLFRRLGELGDERLAPYVAVPERKDALLPLRVVVNGRDIVHLDGRRTVLSDGDDVLVYMYLAGG